MQKTTTVPTCKDETRSKKQRLIRRARKRLAAKNKNHVKNKKSVTFIVGNDEFDEEDDQGYN